MIGISQSLAKRISPLNIDIIEGYYHKVNNDFKRVFKTLKPTITMSQMLLNCLTPIPSWKEQTY